MDQALYSIYNLYVVGLKAAPVQSLHTSLPRSLYLRLSRSPSLPDVMAITEITSASFFLFVVSCTPVYVCFKPA